MGSSSPLYYRYQPLDHRYVRLIRLHPGPLDNEFDDNIQIDLEHRSLGTCDYLALSYTWGPATLEEQDAADAQIFTTVQRCYPVKCKGEIILVTRSLRDGLKRIQRFMQMAAQTDSIGAVPELVWADGICINQDDPQERAEQVQLMTEIYSLARSTLFYLGETGDYQSQTHRALGLAVILARLRAETQYSQIRRTNWGITDPKAYDLVGAQVPSDEDWVEWAIFMNREWFFRTWVLQEVVLSDPNNAYILCGSMWVLADVVILSLEFVSYAEWNLRVGQIVEAASQRNARCRRHLQRLDFWLRETHPHLPVRTKWEPTKRPSFFSISFWQFSQMSCSDPRDRVYGSLGLASEWEDLDRDLLPVDYGLSVSEIYCRATKYVMMRTSSCDILSAVARHKETTNPHGLPSWCPDYSYTIATERPFLLTGYLDPTATKWLASGSDQFIWPDQNEQISLLTLRGMLCGEIKSACLSETEAWTFASPAVFEFLLQNLRKSSPHIRAGMGESFARTVSLYKRNIFPNRERPDYFEYVLARSLTYYVLSVLSYAAYLASGIDRSLAYADICQKVERIATLVSSIIQEEPLARRHLPDPGILHAEVTRHKNIRNFPASRNRPRDLQRLCEEYPDLFPDGETVYSIGRILLNLKSYSHQRALFVTEGGRFGLGHNTLRPGDQVWLLAGARVPFLLRAGSNGRMSMIGEAYVDGVMLGELWDEKRLTTVVLE